MSEIKEIEFTFDKTSQRFSSSIGENAAVLQSIEAFANDKLRAQGHLFLNELLDLLKLPRIAEGQTAGWVWKKYHFDTLVSFRYPGKFGNQNHESIPIRVTIDDDIRDKVWSN